jgi:hypothetical protein
MAQTDYLGRNQTGVSANQTVTGRFFSVQVASAAVTATVKLPDGTKLIDQKQLQVGEVLTLRAGYSEVTKHSGDGVLILDNAQ